MERGRSGHAEQVVTEGTHGLGQRVQAQRSHLSARLNTATYVTINTHTHSLTHHTTHTHTHTHSAQTRKDVQGHPCACGTLMSARVLYITQSALESRDRPGQGLDTLHEERESKSK